MTKEKRIRIEIVGTSRIEYHKYVEVIEDEFHALVVKVRAGSAYDVLRDWVDPSQDVISEEGCDEDWSIIGPDGVDAIDG